MVGKDLAALVPKAVEAAVRTQTSASLVEERLTAGLEQKIALLEYLIQRSLADIAGTLIQSGLEQFVAEQTVAFRATLSDMVREQLRLIEELAKEAIQRNAANQTAGIVDALVRAAACEQIEEAGQRLVPGLLTHKSKQRLRASPLPRKASPCWVLLLLGLLTPFGGRQRLHSRHVLQMLLSGLPVFFTPCGHSLSKS